MRRMEYTGGRKGREGKGRGVKVGVLIVLADSYGVSFEIDAGWGGRSRGVGGSGI